MVLLGRPKNGDIIRAQLRIKESKEFKVSRVCSFITVYDYLCLHAKHGTL